MAYDNSARADAARQTRGRVLAAAGDRFLADGYSRTTIRAVAEAAGVSPETVYKAFGGKAGLLKAVYDVTLAGDDEPIPMGQRPEYQALAAATTPAESAARYAAIAGWLSDRVGPLLAVVLGARGSDPDLEAFAATIDAERLIGAGMRVADWERRGWLREGVTPSHATDVVWTLISPPVHLLLTERGWDREAYEAWLATMLATLLVSAPATAPREPGPAVGRRSTRPAAAQAARAPQPRD